MIVIAAMAAMAQLSTPGVRPAPGSPEDLTGLPTEVLERERADAERSRRSGAAADKPTSGSPFPPSDRLPRCLKLAESDPIAARQMVFDEMLASRPDIAVDGQQCLGMAESALGNWAKAREAFASAARVLPLVGSNSQDYLRQRGALLAAMEGNAALAMGDNAGAVKAFKTALDTAKPLPRGPFTAGIARDYARALVAEGKTVDARLALDEARRDDPKNAEGWLLSAALSRRMGMFAEAQSQVERAGQLDPRNPEVGLEAGRIAAASGFDEAARKSWQSVIAMVPGSPYAERAERYIARLAE